MDASLVAWALFFEASRRASSRFKTLVRLPVDFHGRVPKSSSVATLDSQGSMVGV